MISVTHFASPGVPLDAPAGFKTERHAHCRWNYFIYLFYCYKIQPKEIQNVAVELKKGWQLQFWGFHTRYSFFSHSFVFLFSNKTLNTRPRRAITDKKLSIKYNDTKRQLKALLHQLLVTGTLTNKREGKSAWRYISAVQLRHMTLICSVKPVNSDCNWNGTTRYMAPQTAYRSCSGAFVSHTKQAYSL